MYGDGVSRYGWSVPDAIECSPQWLGGGHIPYEPPRADRSVRCHHLGDEIRHHRWVCPSAGHRVEDENVSWTSAVEKLWSLDDLNVVGNPEEIPLGSLEDVIGINERDHRVHDLPQNEELNE